MMHAFLGEAFSSQFVFFIDHDTDIAAGLDFVDRREDVK
jgi:hypothetical protein